MLILCIITIFSDFALKKYFITKVMGAAEHLGVPTKDQPEEEKKKTPEERKKKPIFTDKNYKKKKSTKDKKKKEQEEKSTTSKQATKSKDKNKAPTRKAKAKPQQQPEEPPIILTPEISYHQTKEKVELICHLRPDTSLHSFHIGERFVNISVVHYTMEKGRGEPHTISLELRE